MKNLRPTNYPLTKPVANLLLLAALLILVVPPPASADSPGKTAGRTPRPEPAPATSTMAESPPDTRQAPQPAFFSSHPFGLLAMPELVGARPPEKRGGVKLTTGYQYDSNAILNAQGAPVPPGFDKKGDSRLLLNLVADYTPLRGKKGAVTVNYAFFHSRHARLSDFNLTQNMIELAGRYRLSERLTLRYSNVYQHLLLGDKLFDDALVTGPSLVVNSGPNQNTTLDLRYRATEYRNVSIFTNNAARTGENYSAGVVHSLTLSPATLIRIGYSYDRDDARSPLWDGEGHKFNLEGNFRLGGNTLLNLYGEYYRKNYDGIYLSIGERREDRAWAAVVTLTTYFQQRYGVSLRALYSKNRSNVAAFQMSRLIPGILFDVRF